METRKLDELPEINLLEDEGITLDGIMSEMVSDYETRYEELTGEEMTLYPADRYRVLLNVAAGQFYQQYQRIQKYFRLNFLKYMYGKYLVNWGGNVGYTETGLKAAETKVKFSLAESLDFVVAIPEGTRITAGDNVYFATEDYAQIDIGETEVEVKATCLTEGTIGNDYAIGQINTLVDPIAYVSEVTNTTVSSGGNDAYSDEELKEILYLFPATSSTTGTEDEYIFLAKQYSTDIVDLLCVNGRVKVSTDYTYDISGAKYKDTGIMYPATISGAYPHKYITVPGFGSLPVFPYSGSSALGGCDAFWVNVGILAVSLRFGNCDYGVQDGACALYLNSPASARGWTICAADLLLPPAGVTV